jgi:8-oxo-dGTP diphosphatase
MADDVTLAAGAVIWRGDAGSPDVLLVHRPRYDDWTLPKGKALAAEPLPLTAVREVREETGLSVTLGRPLPPQGYIRGDRPKRVDYWAATVAGPSLGLPPHIPNHEVDAIEWLPFRQAQYQLTYPRDADLLGALFDAPAITTPYIFVRHAEAGSPSAWRGDDAKRPLDDVGLEQAAVLAEALACYGTARVLSSPAERCVQTVAPYAARLGVPVEHAPALAVDASPQQAIEFMRDLLSPESPVILCGHGERLPALVAWSCAALGAAPPIDPSLGKGAFRILHLAKSAVVDLEYHVV